MTALGPDGTDHVPDLVSASTPPAPDPTQVMMKLITGYWMSQAVGVAAHLGIADALAAGSRSSDELGKTLGAHPNSVYRLMRLLSNDAGIAAPYEPYAYSHSGAVPSRARSAR